MTVRNAALGGIVAASTLWMVMAALVTPAAAQNCWTDVTTHGCTSGNTWHILQFRNNCSGGQRTVNVCVKWTSGSAAGRVNRFGAYANGGQVAEVNPGLCSMGGLRYTYKYDGSVPNCP